MAKAHATTIEFTDSSDIEDAWREEIDRFACEPADWDAADLTALADELDLYRVQASADPNFDATFVEWYEYLWANNLWLALEQCCHDSVLLPKGQRELRVLTCTAKTRDKLGYLLGHCPIHVLNHIALHNWTLVRIERIRRTGSAAWRPVSGCEAKFRATRARIIEP